MTDTPLLVEAAAEAPYVEAEAVAEDAAEDPAEDPA